MASSDSIALVTERDIVSARQIIRKAAEQVGFSLVDQTKIVTATSELARNAVIYGGGGTIAWDVVVDGGRRGLRLTVSDHGPGIGDLTLAMKDGWISGKGSGLGLLGTKRLVNDFEISSKPGVGTTVVLHGGNEARVAMNLHPQQSIAVTDLSSIGEVRRSATLIADRGRMKEPEVGRVSLIAVELATNLFLHATGGEIIIRMLPLETGPGIEIIAVDRGRGIADVRRCLADGYSTSGTRGCGLGAIQRLSTEFDIYSTSRRARW